MDGVKMGIGERLKQEREMKNLSLNDIQKQTKIQTRYLSAIEQERFNVMPGSFYVRAFIKEYATTLGLDAEQLMEEYHHDLPFDQEEKVVLSRVNSSKKNSSTTKAPVIFSFLPTVIVVVLLIGIAFVVWLFSQGYFGGEDKGANIEQTESDNGAGNQVQLPPKNPTEGEDQAEDTEQNEEQVDEKEQSTDQEPTTEINLDSFANNESNYTLVTTEEELELVISTEGQNWLEIENEDGESFYYSTLTNDNSPESIDISDFSQVYLRFGEPNSIQIEINGKPVELSEELGNTTQVQKMWIDIQKESVSSNNEN